MTQLTEAVGIKLTDVTKDGKVFVAPKFTTVARSQEKNLDKHVVFAASGDGEKNFRLLAFGNIPSRAEFEKAGNGGLVEVTFENPRLVSYDFKENEVTKNQMALAVDALKIAGGK
jgi:hypothetical protein